MRQILYILTILFLLNSCKSEHNENVSENNRGSTTAEVVDFDREFNEWLYYHELERSIIVDTTREKAFELWSYRDKLVESDSTFYWYPSKDNSYYLITNFNRDTGKRLPSDYSMDITFRFLKKESNEVFIGVIFFDSLNKRSIDFYWYDSTSFFFLENRLENGDKVLTKLKMGVDSIWTFKIDD